MKKILVASACSYPAKIAKRIAPEIWQNQNYNKEETTKEEEKRVFNEIRRHLKRNNDNIKVIKKSNNVNTTRILASLPLYDSFNQVIHLVDTAAGIVPVETNAINYNCGRAGSVLCSTRAVKKSKYSFKSEMANNILSDPSVRIVSSIYSIEGKNTMSLCKYLENSIPKTKKILILYKILRVCMSLNRKVLDPFSIYIQIPDESDINIIYTPTERKTVCVTEYLMFIVSILLNTYTVMERAVIVRQITMGIQIDKLNDELYSILHMIYNTLVEKEDFRENYAKISEYVLQFMETIQ